MDSNLKNVGTSFHFCFFGGTVAPLWDWAWGLLICSFEQVLGIPFPNLHFEQSSDIWILNNFSRIYEWHNFAIGRVLASHLDDKVQLEYNAYLL